eukprot:4057278-Amphidinium_carterae.1
MIVVATVIRNSFLVVSSFQYPIVSLFKEVLPVASAVDALEQLAFIGLTDEFPLSICLWHVRFGGNVSLADVRKPGKDEGTH